MIQALPIHFAINPILGSPHKRMKYPDKRKMFPIYLNKSGFL